MRQRWLSVLILCGAASVFARELVACGDKFLVPSRGTRFSKAPAVREQANILVYANPASPAAAAIGKVPVEEILREAGYRPTLVSDPEALERALREAEWDLVLADLADSSDLRSRAPARGAPAILPVLVDPTGTALAEAKREFGAALRAPFRGQRLLDTVDDAISRRHASDRDTRSAP